MLNTIIEGNWLRLSENRQNCKSAIQDLWPYSTIDARLYDSAYGFSNFLKVYPATQPYGNCGCRVNMVLPNPDNKTGQELTSLIFKYVWEGK